ncbi:hypothetical protein GCM10007424_27650 [Flavobacterium suaedae]|uniref:2TM domain-containing protein n=1 Tax=Flavobacterium suaedae TaxID=1767027 RepID=A0ABQ1K7S9_9FLAO|nr:2TM domain-containing protein [Flavobacterium suaedae]GGB86066.1 hypothetical protein GCM10007424_27650 [Flavobacterium suaedae]
MEKDFNKHAYNKAVERIKTIKGFYFNLLIYIVTNAILIYINLKYSPQFQWFWYSVVSWGAGLLIYGIKAYGYMPFMGKSWEEKKLKELLGEEDKNTPNTTAEPISKAMQYDRVKNKVRTLRNFYRHLTAYVIVIIILAVLLWVGIKEENDVFVYIAYGTAFGWTIGLIIHFFKLYSSSLFMGKGWEQRKIEELVQKEQINNKKN